MVLSVTDRRLLCFTFFCATRQFFLVLIALFILLPVFRKMWIAVNISFMIVQFCPRLRHVPGSPQLLLPVGVPKEIHLPAVNLPITKVTLLVNYWHAHDTVRVSAHTEESTHCVTCSSKMWDYMRNNLSCLFKKLMSYVCETNTHKCIK